MTDANEPETEARVAERGVPRRRPSRLRPPLADALLAAIVASTDDAIASKSLEGIVTSWNASAERLFGYNAREMLGRHISVLAAPGHEDEFNMILGRIRAGQRIERFETLRRHRDGHLVEIELTVSPIRDAAGEIIGASKIARDIAPRRNAERRQQQLLSELDHRVNNSLTIVQSIARRSITPGPQLDKLLGRLSALAQAHDLLSLTSWKPVSLVKLAAAELKPYRDRVTATGPLLAITATAATTMTLLLHELITNAVRHGALSTAAGWVKLAWWTERDGCDDHFRLRWAEAGGPPVVATQRRGFGRVLLERAPAHDLAGAARLDFAPDGIVYELRAPLATMLEPDPTA